MYMSRQDVIKKIKVILVNQRKLEQPSRKKGVNPATKKMLVFKINSIHILKCVQTLADPVFSVNQITLTVCVAKFDWKRL